MKKIILFLLVSAISLCTTAQDAQPTEAVLKKLNKKYGLVLEFFDGLAQVIKNGKRGVVDIYGKEIIKPQYDKIEFDLETNLAQLENPLDLFTKGKTRIHYIRVSNSRPESKYIYYTGLFTKTGEPFIAPDKYESIKDFENGYAIVTTANGYNDTKYGLIDSTGHEVYAPLYTSLELRDDIVVYKINNKYGFGNLKGTEIATPAYQKIGYFLHNRAWVMKDNLGGYIDKTGVIVIKPAYTNVGAFTDVLAYVKKEGGKFGYIDLNGKLVIDMKYDKAGNFTDGIAEVTLNGETFSIDRTGRKLN